jgi:hypothetical protein
MSDDSLDNPAEIIWSDDACPVCHTRITDPGKFFGIWDGSLGIGSGNWYSKSCENCGSELIGWEYFPAEDSPSRIRWETNRKSR